MGDVIGILNVAVLENLCPEAGQLMTVADLDDMELLNDATVKSQLFVLELRKDSSSKVNTQDVLELQLGLQITLVALKLVLKGTYIISTLEQRAHRFLASTDALNVRLGSNNLLLHLLDSGLDGFALIKGRLECNEIVLLSLNPMIKVSEWVSQAFNSVLEALVQVGGGVVLDDKTIGVLVAVVAQIGFFVVVEDGRCASISLHHQLLLA